MSTAETTHRAELELGPAIDNHEVRWVSSTLVTQGDHQSEGGCLRRLWFERVGGQPRITTAAMTAGVGMHKEIETFLATGNRGALGPVAMAGYHLIDVPGPGLIVEQPIIIGANGQITGVYIRAAGIPFAGHVDLYNHRGFYLNKDGEHRGDPPNTLEVKDWKSTSDLVWAKTPEQVAATVQMNAYAIAGFAMWPHIEEARLTHVYFQRNGKPQAVLATSRPPRRQIEQKWKYIEGVVRTIVDVAREEDPRKVPFNLKACNSYHKDCPHLALCEDGKNARNFDSLDQMFGPRMAERLEARFAGTTIPEEDFFMGFLDQVTGTTVATTPIVPPAGVGLEFSLDDLVAEETAARTALDAIAAIPTPTPEFVAACALIGASGLGMPPLGGNAAALYAAMGGQALAPGATFDGQLKLSKLPRMHEAAELVGLAEEIKRKFPNMNAAPVVQTPAVPAPITVQHIAPAIAILPPDAPASSPALAANPVPGLDNAKSRELAAAQAVPIVGLAESVSGTVPAGSLFGEAPVAAGNAVQGLSTTGTVIAPAPVAPTPANTTAVTPTAEAPKKRGRPPGAGTRKPRTVAAQGDATAVIDSSNVLSVFADCGVEGADTINLMDYIDEACDALIAEFAPTAADIRCTSNETALGFSKWRGALAALAAKQPPAPGNYRVDTRGNELAEIVFTALRNACLSSGGFHVRGTR